MLIRAERPTLTPRPGLSSVGALEQVHAIGLPLYDPGWKNLMLGRETCARPVSSWRFWN